MPTTFIYIHLTNLTGQRIKNVKETAKFDYQLLCDCLMTFNDFDIVASDSNKFKILIKESLLIKRDKSVFNRATKWFTLDLFDQVLMFTFYKKYDHFSIFNKKRKKYFMNCKYEQINCYVQNVSFENALGVRERKLYYLKNMDYSNEMLF